MCIRDSADTDGSEASDLPTSGLGATYFDSTRVLRYAAPGAPRFDHNPTTGESLGLLVEEQRTNLLLRSEEFDNATWPKSNLRAFGSGSTANAIAAPSGTLSADLLIEDTATGEHFVEQNFSTFSGTTYALSVFAKAGTNKTTIVLRLTTTAWNGGTNNQVRFNLSTGSAAIVAGSPTAFSQDLGNGWWRFTLVSTASATGTPAARVHLTDGAGNISYTGDGTSGIYIWGAQLEAGSFPTSYIPTTTTTVTRSADVASITGTAFSSWYRSDGGTNLIEYREPDRSNNRTPRSISDGTSSNRWDAFISSTATVNNRIIVSGSQNNPGSLTANTGSALNKHIIAVGLPNANAAINGLLATASTSSAVPTVDRLIIGADSVGATPLTGTIRRLTHWAARLPDSVLSTLTQ